MSMTDDLKAQYKKREKYIDELKAKKKKLEEARESLVMYKSDVCDSDSSFRSAIRNRSTLLMNIASIKNCRPVEEYYTGMSKTLKSIGAGLVLLVFDWMGVHIALQDGKYDLEIRKIKLEIKTEQGKQAILKKEISALESV